MNLPSLHAPFISTGSIIIVARMRAVLGDTATNCILFMMRDSVHASTPWVMTQTRQTVYTMPLDGVYSPSREVTILE